MIIIIQLVPVYESPYITCVQYIGGYDQYIEGCSMHWRDISSALGFTQYIEGFQRRGVQFIRVF